MKPRQDVDDAVAAALRPHVTEACVMCSACPVLFGGNMMSQQPSATVCAAPAVGRHTVLSACMPCTSTKLQIHNCGPRLGQDVDMGELQAHHGHE